MLSRRPGPFLAPAVALCLAVALPAAAETLTLAAVTGPVAPGSPEVGVQKVVAQRVFALIGYTRWPVPPETHRLCIVGDPGNTGLLQAHGREGHLPRLAVSLLGEKAAPTADCDVLYFGAMSRAGREAILEQWTGKPVLTVGEDDDCAGRLMFCLAIRSEGVSMRANLDSISRAGVKVNANVLNLFGRRRPPE
jgi:hypothetical protein